MPSADDLGQLKTLDWEQLQVLASRFEAAHEGGETFDWEPFLPPAGDPLRATVLYELIKIDLEIRWRRGRAVRLEDYLDLHPELGSAQELPARLVYEEYRARHLFGDKPPLTVYQSRFPDQFPELQRLIEQQPVVASKPPTPWFLPPPASPEAVAAEALPPTANQTISGFTLVKWLGGGSFADVWQAKAPGGVDVAFKLIKQPMDREEAQNELKALELIKGIQHQFLLPLHSFGLANDRLYMVTSLADGTLRDRLKQCRKAGSPGIPLDELIVYLKESAEALDYLHEHKVVHRDIKPENILLKGKHANVADMGLAKAMHSQRFSVTGGGAGTPAYMAPEVWRSEKNLKHCDQYSLACTYAELRMGKRIFAGHSMAEVMYAHLHGEPNLGNLSEAERKVLLKALAKDSSQRYASCQEFARELERAVLPELRQTRPDLFPPPAELPPTAPGSFVIDPSGSTSNVSTLPYQRGQTWRPLAEPPTIPAFVKWLAAGLAVVLLAGGIVWVRAWFTAPPGPRPPITLVRPGPLSLKAGTVKAVPIGITRADFAGPVQLTFADLPAGVIVAASLPGAAGAVSVVKPNRLASDNTVTLAAGESVMQVDFLALPDSAPAAFPVKVRAQAGDYEPEEVILDLTVEPLDYHLPAGWRKAADAALSYVPPDRRVYYNRIEVLRSGVAVPFLLVPRDGRQKPETQRIGTFYIMEDKVWVKLFRAFIHEQRALFAASLLLDDVWGRTVRLLADARDHTRIVWEKLKVNQNDDNPIGAVVAYQAFACAAWLGGLLPEPEQWDKAAGRWEKPADQGPFDGDWQELDKLMPLPVAVTTYAELIGHIMVDQLKQLLSPPVAVRRNMKDGPVARTKPTHDISLFGCRHMSGNGLEWTRRVHGKDLTVPLAAGTDLIVLRGRRYTDLDPLFFKYLGTVQGPCEGTASAIDGQYSFRVVIEP
jgi:serine/threonine protein kinase/formylglycine-generating enzyme required for sulfatase activity